MTTDAELLHRYIREGDEAAFADLVHRHADLVYSIAVRVAGDATLAQDVTQAVFTKLARHARLLAGYPTLVGWLHTTTRHAAINTIRGEVRRRAREQEAFAMHHDSASPNSAWNDIRPLLDEAVGHLREGDRQAVMLRFSNGLSHQEVGAILGLSENSANKRIERALERLREFFTRRGVTTTSAILATIISANSMQAAPVGLAQKIAPASLAATGSTGLGAASFLAFLYMSTKTKTILGLVVATAIAVILAIQWPAADPSTSPATAAQPAPAAKTPAQVAAPVVPAAPAVTVPAASTMTVVTDPQAELATVFPDLVNLIQNGELLTAFQRYMPPSYFAQMPQRVKDQLKQQELNLLSDPQAARSRLALVQILQALQSQAPTPSESGDVVTYQVNPKLENPNRIKAISLTKINGKWYLVPGENALFF